MELRFSQIPAFAGRYLLTLQITDVLDILIIAFLLYKLLTLVRSTKAASLLKGLLVFFAVQIGRAHV